MNKNEHIQNELNELRQQRFAQLERAEIWINNIVSNLTNSVVFIVPAAPALMTTFTIAQLYPTFYSIPSWLAWIAGISTGLAIELLGLASIELYSNMKLYNQQRNKTDTEAPEKPALIVAIGYLIVVFGLITTLKVLPQFANLSVYLIGIMAALVFILTVIRRQFDDMQKERMNAKIERSKLTEYRSTVETLTGQVNELTKKIGQMTSQYGQEIDQLTAQHDQEIDRLTSDHTRVMDTLTAQIDQLKLENDQLKGGHNSGHNSGQLLDTSGHVARSMTGQNLDNDHLILNYFQQNSIQVENMNKSQIATTIGLNRKTFARRFDKLVEDKKIVLNGKVEVL